MSILKKLKYLEFPDSTREALSYLATFFSQDGAVSIPGLGIPGGNFSTEVCNDYILFRTKSRKKLSAIQELQLLEMLCTFFKETPAKSRYMIFNLIFGGMGDNISHVLLTKMVSMALSLSCSPILDCTAIWMQEVGADSHCAVDLSQRLVNDYCLLFPSPSTVFLKLAHVSPLFVCNFIASITFIYTYIESCKTPPKQLLEQITTWITSDCTLCLESVRQVSIHNTYCSPIPGLIGWCVRGPLISSNCSSRPQDHTAKMLHLLSELHFALLQSLQFCNNSPVSQYLLAAEDVVNIIKSMVYLQNKMSLSQESANFHYAIERLAQIIQVATVNGCLRGNRGGCNTVLLRGSLNQYLNHIRFFICYFVLAYSRVALSRVPVSRLLPIPRGGCLVPNVSSIIIIICGRFISMSIHKITQYLEVISWSQIIFLFFYIKYMSLKFIMKQLTNIGLLYL